MKKNIMIIMLITLSTFSLASTNIRGGVRGGGISMGMDTNSNVTENWNLGYGASIIQSVQNPLGVFVSLTNPLDTKNYPAYITMGPIAYFGNAASIGAFVHLGWVGLFNTGGLRFETGLEIYNNRSEVNAELILPL